MTGCVLVEHQLKSALFMIAAHKDRAPIWPVSLKWGDVLACAHAARAIDDLARNVLYLFHESYTFNHKGMIS